MPRSISIWGDRKDPSTINSTTSVEFHLEDINQEFSSLFPQEWDYEMWDQETEFKWDKLDLETAERLAREVITLVARGRELIKHELYRAQNGKCNGCLYPNPIQYMQVDHIVPRAKGGKDAFGNMQLLCGNCNRKKGTDSMDMFLAKLSKEGIRRVPAQEGAQQVEIPF